MKLDNNLKGIALGSAVLVSSCVSDNIPAGFEAQEYKDDVKRSIDEVLVMDYKGVMLPYGVEPLRNGLDYTIDTSGIRVSEEERRKIITFISNELGVYPSGIIGNNKLKIQVVKKLNYENTGIMSRPEHAKGFLRMQNPQFTIVLTEDVLSPLVLHHEFGHFIDFSKKPDSNNDMFFLNRVGEDENGESKSLNSYSNSSPIEKIAVLSQKFFEDTEHLIENMQIYPEFADRLEAFVGAEIDKSQLVSGRLVFTRVYSEEEYKKKFNTKSFQLLAKYQEDIPNYLAYINTIAKK